MKTCMFLASILILFSCQKTDKKPWVKVFGHAGTTIYPERWIYPPNTEESIEYALDVLSAEGTEVDIQLSLDSHFVMYHNHYLHELSELEGCVSEYNLDELISTKIYQSKYHLTSLERAIELVVVQRKKELHLDLKAYNHCLNQSLDSSLVRIAIENVTNELTDEEKKRITLSSGEINYLLACKDLGINTCLEVQSIIEGMNEISGTHIKRLEMDLFDLNPGDKELIQNDSITLVIYNIKTPQHIKMVQEYLPAVIITDNIAGARKNLK